MPTAQELLAILAPFGSAAYSLAQSNNATDALKNSITNKDKTGAADIMGRTGPELQALYDKNYKSQQDLLNPYLNAGTANSSMLNAGLEPGGGLADKYGKEFSFTGKDLDSSPGYQFGLKEGQKAIEAARAALGVKFSGGTIKASNQYATDYAGTKFNDAYAQGLTTHKANEDTFRTDQSDRYNRLKAAADQGFQATGQAVSANQNYTTESGNTKLAIDGQLADYQMRYGEAVAAGDLAKANAIRDSIGMMLSALALMKDPETVAGKDGKDGKDGLPGLPGIPDPRPGTPPPIQIPPIKDTPLPPITYPPINFPQPRPGPLPAPNPPGGGSTTTVTLPDGSSPPDQTQTPWELPRTPQIPGATQPQSPGTPTGPVPQTPPWFTPPDLSGLPLPITAGVAAIPPGTPTGQSTVRVTDTNGNVIQQDPNMTTGVNGAVLGGIVAGGAVTAGLLTAGTAAVAEVAAGLTTAEAAAMGLTEIFAGPISGAQVGATSASTGASNALVTLATNPVTWVVAAGIITAIAITKSQAHHEANTFVKTLQNPFDKAMDTTNKQFGKAVDAGTLTLADAQTMRDGVKTAMDGYEAQRVKFSGQGSDERKVAKQALSTFNAAYGKNGSTMLDWIDSHIERLGGGHRSNSQQLADISEFQPNQVYGESPRTQFNNMTGKYENIRPNEF